MKRCRKCNSKIPSWITINGKPRNLNTRAFCLSCSPFGLHNTRSSVSKKITILTKICPLCNTEKPITEFYVKTKNRECKNPSDYYPYCKECEKSRVKEKARSLKEKCVKYKGGSCIICGYSKNIAALDFHHRNSKEKDFSISQSTTKEFNQIMIDELDKCDLLCSNCHREVHSLL